MKNGKVQVLLVGIGGYGAFYVSALEKPAAANLGEVCAIVDPMIEKSPYWFQFRDSGIPRFDSIQDFLSSGVPADLAVLSSPIALHADQSCMLLEAGVNVLCEKPMAATVADGVRMIDAKNASGRFLEIGYQWSYSTAIQALKADVMSGVFGAPRRLTTLVSWPRTDAYYGRNAWAGRIRDDQGRPVYDSPVNNATAHYLHNMLYVLGARADRAAMPVSVTGECRRANPVENFDAACCRIKTVEQVDVLFYTAHCVREVIGPIFSYEFEQGVVEFGQSAEIIGRFSDGRDKKTYGDPGLDPERKMVHCLQRCRDGSGVPTICGPEAALSQTLCIDGLQRMSVHEFAPEIIRREVRENNETLTFVPGLENAMREGFESGLLLSELSPPWPGSIETVAVESPLRGG